MLNKHKVFLFLKSPDGCFYTSNQYNTVTVLNSKITSFVIWSKAQNNHPYTFLKIDLQSCKE